MESSLPVACTLSAAAFRQRKQLLQTRLLPAIQESLELEDGYALRFPGESEWLSALADFVALERSCCSFLRLEVIAEPGEGPLWLNLRGPAGTKAFLGSEFGIGGGAPSA